ncbi:unnamed protein product [Cuscuta campestris]|uniref:TPX2 central domain-containing protein n=1 Tax=Cuscuta campestris TaxID=132261 RepID=A0A484NNZ4_9ASTE|nr:unnamed protein product [Cuscuta campestris]
MTSTLSQKLGLIHPFSSSSLETPLSESIGGEISRRKSALPASEAAEDHLCCRRNASESAVELKYSVVVSGEEAAVMEEEMEDAVEFTFTVVEIDLDYEFDAPRYFDFSGGESPAEARAAETWFESAGSYPPSPFVKNPISSVANWCGKGSTSPKPKDADSMSLSESESDNELNQEYYSTHVCNTVVQGNGAVIAPTFGSTKVANFQNPPQVLPSGLTFYNHIEKDKSKTKIKFGGKPSYPKTSTLMKPTASHLAKQNPSLVGGVRSLNFMLERSELNTIVSENQAKKRQKLEGGLLHKVADTNTQANFFHKIPKKGTTPKLGEKPQKEAENGESGVYRFKARPLNRKIFEAPSFLPKRSTPQPPQFREFRLKTSERAMQHNSAVLSSNAVSNSTNKVFQKSNTGFTLECGNIEVRRPNVMDQVKQEGSLPTHNFKALPLNKKILSSRGDMGVFRNIKKETTVPMEFNFSTEKRVHHHNPPIELFNKLSLTCGTQPCADASLRLQQPARISSKGCKENRWAHFQQNCEVKETDKREVTRSSSCKADSEFRRRVC